jgi:hypothetical protein
LEVERSGLRFTFHLPVKEVAAWLAARYELIIEQPQPLAITVLLPVEAREKVADSFSLT